MNRQDLLAVLALAPFLGGEGMCEEIQFLLPSLVRLGKEGTRGGRQSRWTNPLESPLTKGDTREVAAKSIFSQLQGAQSGGGRGGR